jgi:hypothetical protein
VVLWILVGGAATVATFRSHGTAGLPFLIAVGVVVAVVTWVAGGGGRRSSVEFVWGTVTRLAVRDLLRRPVGAFAAVVVVAVAAGSLTAAMFEHDWSSDPDRTSQAAPTPTPTSNGLEVRGDTWVAVEDHRLVDRGAASLGSTQMAALSAAAESAGGVAVPARSGVYRGPCEVCGAFEPTLLVVESSAAVDDPVARQSLDEGRIITPFAVASQEGLEVEVAGIPLAVVNGPLPGSAQAMVLAGTPSTPGALLEDPVDVLVVGTGGDGVLDVDELVQAAAVQDSEVVGPDGWALPDGAPQPSTTQIGLWGAALACLVILLTALAATGLFRNEHREAGRVLAVLGAGPRAGRRLASATSGAVAATGVVTGAVLVGSWRLADDGLRGEAAVVLGVAAVAAAIPALVAGVAWLLPPPRPAD